MEMTTDANILCQPRELKILQNLAEVNDQIKTLEGLKQDLVSQTKSIMANYNVNKLSFDGHSYNLIPSTRRTYVRGSKDKFIAELIALGKNHLVRTSIDPDLDGVFAEVEAGTLKADFVDKYVKVTPVAVLRVT